MLPEDLRRDFAPFFFKSEEDEELWKLVKAADKICAYIKCIDEKKAGNTEFDRAAESTLEAVNALGLPEAEEFMREFLGGYKLTLDEIKELLLEHFPQMNLDFFVTFPQTIVNLS